MAFHDYDNEHPEVKNAVDKNVADGKLKMVRSGVWCALCKKV